jgi:hypothetical protein
MAIRHGVQCMRRKGGVKTLFVGISLSSYSFHHTVRCWLLLPLLSPATAWRTHLHCMATQTAHRGRHTGYVKLQLVNTLFNDSSCVSASQSSSAGA